MLIRKDMHGYIVRYEEDEHNISHGVYHLSEHLSSGEVRTIFEAAHDHSSADFEDAESRNYSLIYKGNNEYILMSRS